MRSGRSGEEEGENARGQTKSAKMVAGSAKKINSKIVIPSPGLFRLPTMPTANDEWSNNKRKENNLML
jgi:hypothetical protein